MIIRLGFCENIAILLFCLVMVAFMVIVIMKKQASNVITDKFCEGDNLVSFVPPPTLFRTRCFKKFAE